MKKKRIVLMYHDIYDLSPDESGFNRESMLQYKVLRKDFVEQVESISQFVKTNKDTEIIFSFDDGGLSSFTLAAPILEEHGIKGLFFVSTKYLNKDGFLTSEHLIELEKRGHKIGSHSYSHPNNLKELDANEQNMEWERSFEDLYKILGHKVEDISIPNGYYDNNSLPFLGEAGIINIYTSEPTIKIRSTGPINIFGRYVIHNGMTTEDVMSLLSPKKRFLLSLRWSILNVLKVVLGNRYSSIKKFILKLL